MECKFEEAMWTGLLHDQLVLGIRDSKMITELLKLKLGDLSFDLVGQKCLAIEQAGNKRCSTTSGGTGARYTSK